MLALMLFFAAVAAVATSLLIDRLRRWIHFRQVRARLDWASGTAPPRAPHGRQAKLEHCQRIA